MQNNPILDGGNQPIRVTNLLGTNATGPLGTRTLDGLPLGTAGGSPTGEVAVKVNVLSGGNSPQVVTAHFVSVPASTSGTIPANSKGWTISFLSGTGSFGGVIVGVGFSDSDVNTNVAALAYTTDSASTAYVRYNT